MTTKTRDITFMPSENSRSRSMCGLLAVAVCGLLTALTAPSARAQLCTPPDPQCGSLLSYGGVCDGLVSQEGEYDNFCPGPNPTEPATPTLPFGGSPHCNNSVGASVGYDHNTIDRIFCESFTVKNPIGGAAILEIRLKGLGSGLNFNDSIVLFGGPGFTQLWTRRIGSDVGAGLTGLLGVPWSGGDTHSFCLNLSALPNETGPPTNILSGLSGFLHIEVQDDTAVDYATLFESQCEKIVPTVSEWGLGALALLLLSGVALKFGRRRAVV